MAQKALSAGKALCSTVAIPAAPGGRRTCASRGASLLSLILFWLFLAAAAQAVPPGARVLVIINDNSAASQEIGAYYVSRRHVPAANVCHLHCPADEQVDEQTFTQTILTPVAIALGRPPLSQNVDFLLLTKGVPLRIGAGGDSLDSRLMCQDLVLPSPARNPFFDAHHRFSHRLYHLYLTTRLDGYTAADAKALVDHALAARPARGRFLLDSDPTKAGTGYGPLDAGLTVAARNLQARGFVVTLDQTASFAGPFPLLMGYWSWGSNDAHYDVDVYRKNRWRPGAIAETAVSTSARTMLPTIGGQSLIADIIATGVTGVKGYVSEPYVTAIARPSILFDRYTRGWTLAEAFYAASPYAHWKDVVIGDPLCAPYAKAR